MNEVQVLSTTHDEPAWLAERREKAWEWFSTGPRPDRVTHLWRYTEPRHFELPEAWRPGAVGEVPLPRHVSDGLDRGELEAGAAVGAGEIGHSFGEGQRQLSDDLGR